VRSRRTPSGPLRSRRLWARARGQGRSVALARSRPLWHARSGHARSGHARSGRAGSGHARSPQALPPPSPSLHPMAERANDPAVDGAHRSRLSPDARTCRRRPALDRPAVGIAAQCKSEVLEASIRPAPLRGQLASVAARARAWTEVAPAVTSGTEVLVTYQLLWSLTARRRRHEPEGSPATSPRGRWSVTSDGRLAVPVAYHARWQMTRMQAGDAARGRDLARRSRGPRPGATQPGAATWRDAAGGRDLARRSPGARPEPARSGAGPRTGDPDYRSSRRRPCRRPSPCRSRGLA
jgi:hypothetical protein